MGTSRSQNVATTHGPSWSWFDSKGPRRQITVEPERGTVELDEPVLGSVSQFILMFIEIYRAIELFGHLQPAEPFRAI